MIEGPDPLPGFLAAAFAAAMATGLYFRFFEPLAGSGTPMLHAQNVSLAGLAFIVALFVAALHIGFLAAPLHALLSRNRAPGPVAILLSATLIGALPIPLLSRGSGPDFVLFGAVGLVGGVAFLAVTRRLERAGEGE